MYPICCGIVGQCTRAPRVRNGSRLCEKSREPRKRRIVFSIAVSRPRLPAQLVSVSMKLRQMFYTQIERRTFHTAWTRKRHQAETRKSNIPPFQTVIRKVDRLGRDGMLGHNRKRSGASVDLSSLTERRVATSADLSAATFDWPSSQEPQLSR